MVFRWFAILFVILIPAFARAQVVFTSPLPGGILQVHGNHADMRIHVAIVGHSNFEYKLSSDIDTSNFQEGWYPISIQNGIVDTMLTVPKSRVNYALYWRTGIDTADTNGLIPGLTPGHIIGIAGQSNAVGYVWPPWPIFVAVPQGDIRMLINDTAWQPAGEPTDGAGQGPWIEMANELFASIGDTLPIGIVNTAVGGTGLTTSIGSGRWLKNSPDPADSMYPDAIDRFRHAGSELDYFTWIQGEADGEAAQLLDPNIYRNQFITLVNEFWTDLQDTFPIFHLQISGYSGRSGAAAYPQAREALRVLPPSTLVGTAVGRPIWDSGFHYTVETYRTVGRIFAAAVLNKEYGIDSSMYPPLLPDTAATIDSITDGSIPGKYCVSIRWTRGGKPVKLTIVHPDQYFALDAGSLPLDTPLVSYRIAPDDSSRVQVWLRSSAITLNYNWFLTYDATAGGELAPLATIDPVSGDTIFATAFYELPVQPPVSPPADVKAFDVQYIAPNPTNDAFQCDLFSYKYQTVTIKVLDDRGVTLLAQPATLQEGMQSISIPTGGLPSGNYWIVVRDANGNESVQKALLVR